MNRNRKRVCHSSHGGTSLCFEYILQCIICKLIDNVVELLVHCFKHCQFTTDRKLLYHQNSYLMSSNSSTLKITF